MGKPCWVLVYSALLVALFSGIAVEDMFFGLTALPSGWYVEWVVSLANTNSTDWCHDEACTRHHSVGGVSAPAEGPSHSTDQPGGKVHGQVKLAIISSKSVPESSATSKAEYTNTQQGLPVIGYTLVH